MRSLIDKLMDAWGGLGLWNQFGIAFVGAVIVIAILVAAF